MERQADANKRKAKLAMKKVIGKKLKQKPRKKAYSAGGGLVLTREQAKAFLPQIVGCTIQKDTKLHMRWKGIYPNEEAPFSISKVWDEKTSDREAMLKCLNWSWDCHSEVTGEACPFDLTA